MGSNPFGKVSPGQEVEFNATAWNSFIDAAKAERKRKHSRTSGLSEILRQASIIRIKNASGLNLSRYSILGISAPLVSPGSNLTVFLNEVTFSCGIPATGSTGKFVISLDPLASGAIGRAVVAGVVAAKVNIVATTHTSCDIVSGSTANLITSTAGGSAQILWQESGTGVKWCIVRIGTKCPG